MGFSKAVPSDRMAVPSGYARWYLGSSGHAILVPQQVATLLVDLAAQAEMEDAVDVGAAANGSKISCVPDVAPLPKKPGRDPDPFRVDTGELDHLDKAGAPTAPATHRVWHMGVFRERIERHNGRPRGA